MEHTSSLLGQQVPLAHDRASSSPNASFDVTIVAYVWCALATLAILILYVRKRRFQRAAKCGTLHAPLQTSDPLDAEYTQTAAPALQGDACHDDWRASVDEDQDGRHTLKGARDDSNQPMPDARSQPSTSDTIDGRAFQDGLRRSNMRVRIKDLQSEPQLNGEDGIAINRVESSDGPRWNVRCLNGTRLCLKQRNLEIVLADDAADVEHESGLRS